MSSPFQAANTVKIVDVGPPGPPPQPHRPISTLKKKRTFKVILIGDAGVGKTCLSFRFCNGRFPDNTEATIGVDFRERNITIDDELLRVQLWDTAGQERYRASMMSHYYRNVNAVVFVYDMTNRLSFANLKNWLNECSKYADVSEIPRILIGNKCDCVDSLALPTDEVQRFADHNDMPLFETSAKEDSMADHVESIFMTLVHKLRESKAMHVQSDDERIRVQKQQRLEQEEEMGYCC